MRWTALVLPIPLLTNAEDAILFFSVQTVQGNANADSVCTTDGTASDSPLLGGGKIYRALRADYLTLPKLQVLAPMLNRVTDRVFFSFD